MKMQLAVRSDLQDWLENNIKEAAKLGDAAMLDTAEVRRGLFLVTASLFLPCFFEVVIFLL